MEYQPLPIGISDFAEMIQKEFYYVDKTLIIRDLLDSKAKVTLFARPRRFGKALNMSMTGMLMGKVPVRIKETGRISLRD